MPIPSGTGLVLHSPSTGREVVCIGLVTICVSRCIPCRNAERNRVVRAVLPSSPRPRRSHSQRSYQKAMGTSLSRRSFETSPSIPIPASTIPRKVTLPRGSRHHQTTWAMVGVQTNGTLIDCPAARVMLNVHSWIMTPMGCHISSLASAVTGDGSTPICWKVTLT